MQGILTHTGRNTHTDTEIEREGERESQTDIHMHTLTPADAQTPPCTAYASLKCSHLDTAAACAANGVRFQPLAAESTGAWEAGAGKPLLHLARGVALREGVDVQTLHGQLLQQLSVTIRAHHARAVLLRRAAVAAASEGQSTSAEVLAQPAV